MCWLCELPYELLELLTSSTDTLLHRLAWLDAMDGLRRKDEKS